MNPAHLISREPYYFPLTNVLNTLQNESTSSNFSSDNNAQINFHYMDVTQFIIPISNYQTCPSDYSQESVFMTEPLLPYNCPPQDDCFGNMHL